MFAKPPNVILKSMWRKIPKHILITFLSALFIGLVAHMFIFTNTLPVHDQVRALTGNIDWALDQGRWFLDYVILLTGIFSLPWVNGFMSIIYISISSCLVVSLMKVKGHITCVLISALMVTFPGVAGFFPYMHMADAVFFALLLNCLAAFLAERYKYGFIFAVVPVVLSLAIYQAYFSVTAALMVMILIIDVLKARTTWQKTLYKGIRFVCTLGASMILYLVSVMILFPYGLTAYQGYDQMGQLPLHDLPNRIFSAYVEIARFFLLDGRNFHFSFLSIAFILAFVACGVLLVLWCIRKKLYQEPIRLMFLGALLVVLPFGCNLIYLMGPAEVHDLMIYSRVFILVFVLVIVDLYIDNNSDIRDWADTKLRKSLFDKAPKIFAWIVALTMALTVYSYWIVSNQAYFKLNIAYQTTFARSVMLVSSIQSLERYSYDMDVVLVGLPYNPQGIPELEQITLTGAIGTELFGSWSYTYFLRYFLNFTQNVTHLGLGIPMLRCEDLASAIRDMPMYPNAGSIAIINDSIFVRFPYIDNCCWNYWPRELPACCGT